ncbi:MAG TPA: hypothetical protein VFH03_14075 [Actinoplanes sp.]|nr:hypothetical protein [Actinoplanes sp.]
MTDERNDAPVEPNEAGFGGDPSTPTPDPGADDPDLARAENVAVPSDDLTGPITDALEDSMTSDDDR